MNAIAPYSFGLPDLPWYVTLIAVVASIIALNIGSHSSKGNMPARQAGWTAKSTSIAAFLIICLICSAWLILIGIEAIGTWSVPDIENPNPGRRGGGMVIFIIKYLPYVSVFIGLASSLMITHWFADKLKLKYSNFIWLIFAVGVILLVIHNASIPKVQRSNEPSGPSYVHNYGTVQISFVDTDSEFKKAKSYLLGWSNKKFDRPHSLALCFDLPRDRETPLYKESEFATLLLGTHFDADSEFKIRSFPIISDKSVLLMFELSPQILNSIELDSRIRLSINGTDLIASDELDQALRFIAFDYRNNGASCFAPHSMSDTAWSYTGLCKQLGNAIIAWKQGEFPSHVTDIVVNREPGNVQPKSIVLFLASEKLADSVSADVLDEMSIMITSGAFSGAISNVMEFEQIYTDSMTGETEAWSKDRRRSVQPCLLTTSLFNEDILIYAKILGQTMGLNNVSGLDQMANADQRIGILELNIMPFLDTEGKSNLVEKAVVRFGEIEGVLSEDLIQLILEAASLTANRDDIGS